MLSHEATKMRKDEIKKHPSENKKEYLTYRYNNIINNLNNNVKKSNSTNHIKYRSTSNPSNCRKNNNNKYINDFYEEDNTLNKLTKTNKC